MTDKRMQALAFSQRVLVLLCGTSPAVLTETLQVISDPGQRLHFPPTKIVVITTRVGRELIKAELLDKSVNSASGSGRVGRLQRMAQDLGLATFPLSEQDILVPVQMAKDGALEIDDAHSSAELDAIGELIFDTVRQHTIDANTALMLSLSGGRKSMAHIAGQCMSAYARPWDKLVHVIVQPNGVERESAQPRFYYQAPNDNGDIRWIDQNGDAQGVAIKQVSLQLTEEPFFRLNPLLLSACHQRSVDFQSLNFSNLIAMLGGTPKAALALEINSALGTFTVDGRPPKKPDGASYAAVSAYLQLLHETNVPIPRLLKDSQTCRLLEIWDRVANAFDDRDRFAQLNMIFDEIGTLAESQRSCSNFNIETVAAKFRIDPSGATCSLTTPKGGQEWISHLATATENCIPSALPFGVVPSDYSIYPRRGWRAIPPSLKVTVRGA